VVDRGTGFELYPAVPPDRIVDGVVRYGSSGSVPSRLAEPASGPASVVIVPWSSSPGACLDTAAAVRSLASPDVSVVTVLAPGGGKDASMLGDPTGTDRGGRTGEREVSDAHPDARSDAARPEARSEVIQMARAGSPGTTANAGIRRASGGVLILAAGGSTPSGDIVGPLVDALVDPGVAIAGGWGSVTRDLRRREPVEAGDADILGPWCFGFRRDDFLAHGPLDERFLTAEGLAAWWSLVVRDRGQGVPPRRAVVVPGLPLRLPPDARADRARTAAVAVPALERAQKRDFYRLLDRFGRRPYLTRGRTGP
jgi:hypothetical protein